MLALMDQRGNHQAHGEGGEAQGGQEHDGGCEASRDTDARQPQDRRVQHQHDHGSHHQVGEDPGELRQDPPRHTDQDQAAQSAPCHDPPPDHLPGPAPGGHQQLQVLPNPGLSAIVHSHGAYSRAWAL